MEILENISKTSYRLKQELDFIYSAGGEFAFQQGAMASVIEKYENNPILSNILLKNLNIAIESSKEFNIPLFKDKLISVFSKSGIIELSPRLELDKIECLVLAEEYAGFPEEYQTAVELAYFTLYSSSPFDRSFFWKILYTVAREGRVIRKKSRKEGGENKVNENAMKKMASLYWATIERRVQLGSLAPFWYILNYGSSAYGEAVGTAGGGGFAYPNNNPTYFVEKTIFEIEEILRGEYLSKVEELETEFYREIEIYLENLETYQPGEILKEITVLNEKYIIYKTPKLGKLGFRKV